MYKYIICVLLICSGQIATSQTISSIKNAKPFEVKGSLGGNLGLYSVNGIDERTSPFQYGLSARLNFSIYSFKIPVYASIRDNSFNYGGSFSRIRISPQWKWIKLHIGDTYITYNPYTLAGRTIKGYGVELTPGKFRFKFLKGKVEDLRSYTDSLELGTIFTPTYSRKTTSAAIGFGSASNYVDIYAVSTADRLDSLNGEVALQEFTRRSNSVLGSSFAFKLSRAISIRSNLGLSFQTDNLDSPGENTIIGENPVSNNLAEGNISSAYTYAGDVSLNYSGKLFSLNGKVKYVQPYFQPLTVAFVNTDIINYTVGGSTSFFKRRLNITGSVGIQRNNLTGSKLSTANNLITNMAANFRLGKGFSGTLTYSNFTQDYEARLVQISDLYTYAITSNVKSGSLRYTFGKGNNKYNITMRGGTNNFFTIDNSETETAGAYDSYNTAFSVGLNNTEKHIRINTMLTYRKYNRETSTTANYGLRITANKGLYENKLNIRAETGFSYNDLNGFREGNTWRGGGSAAYKLDKKSNLSIRLNYINRSSAVRSDFSEYRMGVQYMYSF